MIRLIATDMDGTLLDEASRVPDETFGLVEELHELGVPFVATTGRMYDRCLDFFAPVADKVDYVASLGTQVYADGECLAQERFDSDAVRRLHEVCEMFDCLHLSVYDEEGAILVTEDPDAVLRLDDDLMGLRCMRELPDPLMPIVKVSVCCTRADQLTNMALVMERELSDVLSFWPSGQVWIDILPRHVSKATGLALVLGHYGIDRADVLAFGDSLNDYAMLRYAGHPWAMGNAGYAVRQIAERVVGTNVEHGEQWAIRELIDSGAL